MPKVNSKRICLQSTCLKIIIIIGTIFFIFTLGYFFYLRAKIEMIKDCYLNLLTLERELNGRLKKISTIPHNKEKIKKLKIKFDIYVNGYLNKLVSLISHSQSITLNSEIAKINFLDIKTENLLVSLKIENNFVSINAIINFLNTVASLDKFILIENFSWNILNNLSESKKQKQNIFFLFRMYSFNTNKKNLILSLLKTIKLSIKSAIDKSLIKFSLNKISMVGYYELNKIKNFGLVILPTKQVFIVQLGDQLGLEGGRVIGIYDQYIFILNKTINKIIKLSIENRKLTYVKNFS